MFVLPGAARKQVMGLVAKVDPENVPSERIVKRVGARRGEVLEKHFALANGVQRDIGCWYIDRPGTQPVPVGDRNE